MTGEELRERIKRLGLSYTAAAPRLGLSVSGLHHNLRDERKITRQTEIILEMLERELHDRTPPKSTTLRQEPAPVTTPRRRPRIAAP
jgi:hypothetical protein